MTEREIRCGEISAKTNRRCGKLLFEMKREGVAVKCLNCGKVVIFPYRQFLEAIEPFVRGDPRVLKRLYLVSRLLEED